MAKLNFSDVGIRALPKPGQGQKSYWDTSLPGFGVRVSQGGSKTFVLNRDNNLITIGRFGVVSLSEARTEAKRLLAERTLGKVRPQSVSFHTALDDFLAEKEKTRRTRTVGNLRDRLRLHFPFKCQLGDITHNELLRRLEKIATNAEYDHALSVAKTFFTWAHNRRYIDDNPTRGISPRGTQSRSRVLTDEELLTIWKACEHLPATFARIVQLLILTGQRRNEIARLKAEYIDLDNQTICQYLSLRKICTHWWDECSSLLRTTSRHKRHRSGTDALVCFL